MKEKRDEIIILRLTKTEKNRIYEKMFSMGIRSLSAYIRKMALDGYCLNLDLPQLRRMAYLLQNCSNNLNQVAKRVNESGKKMCIRDSCTRNKNNHSPRLTVPATVVAKRTDVSHSSSANAGDMSGAHGYDTSTFTSYYVTFQVESGDRMEFEVDGSDYGLLVQGDIGKLSFQGTRYLGFERS